MVSSNDGQTGKFPSGAGRPYPSGSRGSGPGPEATQGSKDPSREGREGVRQGDKGGDLGSSQASTQERPAERSGSDQGPSGAEGVRQDHEGSSASERPEPVARSTTWVIGVGPRGNVVVTKFPPIQYAKIDVVVGEMPE